MSKKVNKPGDDSAVNVAEVYSKTEKYVDDNRNTLLIIAGILVVLFAGYFAVTRLYLQPRSEEAMNLMWKAEYWFEIDSLDKALVGNESYYGFEFIADEYSNTKAGDLASYYSGVIYLRNSDYQMALNYLKNADLEDEIVGAMAKGGMGDAYVQLGDYDKAISSYSDAISHSKNLLTAPMYLKKQGLVYEDQGKFKEALTNYKRIKDDFPTSNEARSIDSYIARVGG
ncbi:tetratricopeptide repeat protein [Cryomorpha ignava]|uniref:Tetratricopeptide repeat protein n=1 Tax=Cryomorpha ignava TaxID=101383 RepID=A0A7K3WQT7_9FLAO|nr:tetratricopeptide repeat protein [Cryomorpha ignava]NEN23888.1 tetratricopeptide repeat protein [Cryomorpha ignava]